jgi:hypothetical protein
MNEQKNRGLNAPFFSLKDKIIISNLVSVILYKDYH